MLLQIHSDNIRKAARRNDPHAFRGAVPPDEKLLLLAILLVVAAWIAFRVALTIAMVG